MESDVSLTQNWRSRRFFLSNLRSAPRLFCCNTSNGFTFGEINLDNNELQCEEVDHSMDRCGFPIDHLCWFPETIHRPSRQQLKIGFTSLSTSNRSAQTTAIYQNSDTEQSSPALQSLDETNTHSASAIDYNESLGQLAVSYLDGTVKIYRASNRRLISQSSFSTEGLLHRLEWNPVEPHLLLLAHQHRLNLFDVRRQTSALTLNQTGKEHLADCTWKTADVLIGRHRQNVLVWDKRISREPVRNETVDCFGQSEKLKCSLASPGHLLSLYDSRLNKLKIYDFRFLTMRQVESFDQMASSFLDYYWTIDRTAIVVATHQDLLHWIDVDVPKQCQLIKTNFSLQ